MTSTSGVDQPAVRITFESLARATAFLEAVPFLQDTYEFAGGITGAALEQPGNLAS
jgi:hypothetical protein